MRQVPDFLEFRYLATPIRLNRGYSVLMLLSMLPLLPALVGHAKVFALEAESWALSRELVLMIGISIVLVALFGLAVWAARQGGLRVDSHGFQCRPQLHSPVSEVIGYPWSLRWVDIERAVVYLPPAKERSVIKWAKAILCLEAGDREFRLPLLYLDPRNAPLDRRLPFLPSRMRERVRQLLLDHPLLAMIKAQGVPVDIEELNRQTLRRLRRRARVQRQEARAAGQVDLLGQPSTVFLLVVLVVLALFLALDQLVLSPVRPLWEPDLWVPAVVGAGAFVVAAAIAGRVRAAERFVLAALVGRLTALAWNPAELRVQLSGSGAAGEPFPYVATAPALFTPVQEGYPLIDLRDLDLPEYWNAHPAGAEHPFHLLMVGEGRYVLKLEPLFERTRAFYADR